MADSLLQPYVEALDEFPLTGTSEAKARAALKYAVLAPSSHNSQPWLFRVLRSGIELFADRSRALPVVDPRDRELVISCGAALFNLRAALRNFGCRELTVTLPDPAQPDLLARVEVKDGYEPSDEDRALFQAIGRRRTFRFPFGPESVPATLLTMLERAATLEGATLGVLQTPVGRDAIADFVARADRIQLGDRPFRRELAAWMHPNRTRSRDGMPGYALGLGEVASVAAPLAIRTFDVGRGQAAEHEALVRGSPVLAVFTTAADTPRDWLAAGQALARVLLRAEVEGVSASFLNQPIEVPELRQQLQILIGGNDVPQLLIRLGYGRTVRATPRRPVADVEIR
jgi:nitroreductase